MKPSPLEKVAFAKRYAKQMTDEESKTFALFIFNANKNHRHLSSSPRTIPRARSFSKGEAKTRRHCASNQSLPLALARKRGRGTARGFRSLLREPRVRWKELLQHKLTFYSCRREIQTASPFALRVSTSQHIGVASLKMTAEMSLL